MEETLKISIGGVAFIINKNAYAKLENYLKALAAHYSARPEGKEILDDIERRIAELLLDKFDKEDVVTEERINKVIAVMGRPQEIDVDDETIGNTENANAQGSANTGSSSSYNGGNQSSEAGRSNRKLFRDMDNHVIGGVCSGLAAYCKIDPVIMRLIFVVAFILGSLGRHFLWISGHGFGWTHFGNLVFLAYILLWIIMPKAKTVEDKCAMKGSAPGVQGVEYDYNNSNGPRGEEFGRILKIIFGIICILASLGGLITGLVYYFASGLRFGTTPLSVLNYFDFQGNVFFINTLRMIVWLLPCCILMYLGIRWTFNFKMPKFRPGLIAFGVWVISLILLLVFGAAAVEQTFDFTKQSSTQTLSKNYDTLYVNYANLPNSPDSSFVDLEGRDFAAEVSRGGVLLHGIFNWNSDVDDFENNLYDDDECNDSTTIITPLKTVVKPDGDNTYSCGYRTFWTKDRHGKAIFAIYPKFSVSSVAASTIVYDKDSAKSKVVRDLSVTPIIEIEMKRSYGREKMITSKIYPNGNYESNLISIKDSVITIYPQIISRSKKFSGTLVNAKITVPDGNIVVVNKLKR
ncbi:MAG TPA: PspC domain-containing protein [Candidatus Egerieousia sp.]|nr:PspC domain-containing protein [Candidatus Egerieousia sp.]HPT05287.1 PspC domain-containing protein [Candidatus Egerieousia sp.]